MPAATVARARVKRRNPDLRCDVLQGVGWFAHCHRCLWNGRIRDIDAAREEAAAHRCEDASPSRGTEAS